VRAWLRHGRHVIAENPVTGGAFALFVLLAAVAVLGPWVAPHDPLASNAARTLEPPSARHWFGTDQLGRDILSRVIVATRLDLVLALTAVALSFAIGSTLGACAGFFGGWTDRAVTRVADTIMAFPLFVLAMGIVAALGNTLANIVYATAIIGIRTPRASSPPRRARAPSSRISRPSRARSPTCDSRCRRAATARDASAPPRVRRAAAAPRPRGAGTPRGLPEAALSPPIDGAALLDVRSLTKRFPVRGGGSLVAVDDVSFAIQPGESVRLVGESGCGKSTLVRLITRLLEPSDGRIVFQGPTSAGSPPPPSPARPSAASSRWCSRTRWTA
jgi:ABC-type multidrug transport system fused ATPase/permease subunit